LYTIIGRLLDLIDELTNWYIRFNRKRLKGEDNKEDTVTALNTLFEALFTLTRTMVCGPARGGWSGADPYLEMSISRHTLLS
jgi:isoleucyl-tRNA synthetase